ncbi:MAG: DUF1735 domain-containing protein [Niabella sp.]
MKAGIQALGIFLLFLTITGCKKYADYQVDNNLSTVYFPYQKPVRTIVAEGSNGNFEVGVMLGGLRNNEKNIEVGFKVEPSLLDDAGIMDGKSFELLPASYYSLADGAKIVIPAGSFDGTVKVTLTQQFFADPKALEKNYVLPLVITSSTSDSVLRGSVENGIAAKDYTVVVLKYINQYDATYYHRGVRYGFDAAGNPVDTLQYVRPEEESQYMKNHVWTLTTTSLNTLVTDGVAFNTTQAGQPYNLKLVVDDNKNVKIENVSTSLINNVIDNGGSRYDAENKKFYLNYEYTNEPANKTYKMKDTLIFRNYNLALETW